LIFLLCITTLFSHRQLKGELASSLAAPIFILFGYLISPQALGLVLPSVVASMTPALRVAILLVSFISGLLFFDFPIVGKMRDFFSRDVVSSLVIAAATAAFLVFLYGFNLLDFQSFSLWSLIGIGLILSALFLKDLDALSIILVAVGEAFLRFQGDHGKLAVYLASALGLSLVLAVAAKLLTGNENVRSTSFRLSLLGMLILGTGMATNLAVNEAFVGFMLGAALHLFPYKKMEKIKTKDLETPLLLFIYFFMGLHLRLEFSALGIGCALAFVRLLILYFVGGKENFCLDQIKISRIALPLAFSIYLSVSQSLQTTFYLSVITGGVILTEVLGLQFRFPGRGENGNG
jgi:hypothetical protein